MNHILPRAILVLSLALLLCACGASGGEQQGDGGGPSDSQTMFSGSEPSSVEETSSSAGSTTARRGPVQVETTVVASGLEAPWALAFTPDGDALVTERDSARILSVSPSGRAREVGTLPADGVGEGGLLGLALSPDFESDGFVYAYYTTAGDNRIVRFRLGEEDAAENIFAGIPVNSYHNGGRISFGPDGKLYVGTGDAGDTATSQDVNSLGGKILRLEPDGSIPPDNPFGPDNPAYSYGHRNVQGLAWDDEGRLFATEFGQDTYDEVNRVEPGRNYGWPEVEGEKGPFASEEFVDPISVWSTDEASPSGAEILRGGGIPQWEGDFFMAGLRGERLWRLDLAPDGTVRGREELLSGQAGRLRHVEQAPDGSLWVLTSNRDGRGSPAADDDRILRLGPVQS